MMTCKMKYQRSHKMRCRPPLQGKASNDYGIRGEDIKTCDETTKERIKQIFNVVMKQEDCTPERWRRMRTIVIYTKGNVEEVGNYRPICTLSALTLIYNRLHDRLDRGQPGDQGGFRRSYQTLDDHLATYRLFERTCQRSKNAVSNHNTSVC